MAKVENNKIIWENSEFPIICESCLGPNPYVRMTKQTFGKECKVCARPFTVFRWSPGNGMRHKKTEICTTCAKVKNVCQTCILDLQYNLPTQLRDKGLGIDSAIPTDRVNRDYFIKNAERKIENGELVYDFQQANNAGKSLLKRMARAEPFYQRNRPHICSFYVKGSCTRGDTCPYRHELPEKNDLGKQNIMDRYMGRDDPVALKLIDKANNMSSLAIPEDKSITSLFLTGIQPEIANEEVKKHFSKYGEIRSVVLSHKAKCGFVNFMDRDGAVKAAEDSLDVNINGHEINVSWAKPKPKGPRNEIKENKIDKTAIQDLLLPPPSVSSSNSYPSQDPTILGSHPQRK